MNISKKTFFCCFIAFNITAMNTKRKVTTQNPSITYYQNIEDFQHNDGVNNGFKKSKADNQSDNCIVIISSCSKKADCHFIDN